MSYLFESTSFKSDLILDIVGTITGSYSRPHAQSFACSMLIHGTVNLVLTRQLIKGLVRDNGIEPLSMV